MTQKHKLSLITVILININIMIGTGIFINITTLSQKVGILSTLSYGLVALLLLPLILTVVRLLELFPTGGFYSFGARGLHPFVGFIATWSYFAAKLGSATIGIHTFVTIVQQLLPATHILPPLVADNALILFFIFLNTLNVEIGSTIQMVFTALKLTPIIFLLLVGGFFIDPTAFHYTVDQLSAIPSTIPIVLFSFLGFEAACSLSNQMEDPTHNAPRAVLISYCAVILIYIAYQTFFYGIVGSAFEGMDSYKDAFPALFGNIFSNVLIQQYAILFAYLAIACSALSAAYGILFSNQWNLYMLATNHHLLFSEQIKRLNKYAIPYWCTIIQGIICMFYIVATYAHQILLQQLAAFGSIITYSLCTITLLILCLRAHHSIIIPLLGLGSCLLLSGVCFYNLWITHFTILFYFALWLITGCALFWYTSRSAQQTSN